MRLFPLTLALFAAAAQPSSTPLTVDRATALVKDYARGLTEVQFDAACTITNTTAKGARTTTHKTTHIFEVTKSRFRGDDSSAEADWNSTWRTSNAGHKTVGFELYEDGIFIQPVAVFGPGARKEWTFNPSADKVAFHSANPCQSFQPDKDKRFRLTFCGAGEISGITDVGPMKIHFEALGLPVTAGKETLNSYRADGELVSVDLPGSSRPFLFPKHAVSTYEFATGDETIECSYTQRPKRKH